MVQHIERGCTKTTCASDKGTSSSAIHLFPPPATKGRDQLRAPLLLAIIQRPMAMLEHSFCSSWQLPKGGSTGATKLGRHCSCLRGVGPHLDILAHCHGSRMKQAQRPLISQSSTKAHRICHCRGGWWIRRGASLIFRKALGLQDTPGELSSSDGSG